MLYNCEVFWYLMGKKSSLLVSHYPPPPPPSLAEPADTNLLLTEREGRTGEYWPEVVTVRTERREVRTKATEGQYSAVRPKQARLVSSLLYSTLFLIVKCTSGGLHLKNDRPLHPSLKFRKNFNLFNFCWSFQCEE